ncbi:hypothetical protein NHX12_027337 [Muraenolepis orangiensis]|uniref:Annexin n=1 Tax=Muraenolepis orangiensis TaxID=630683 RepID=A0A9Q0EC51_9TELE|nr:hypothetical protein NHX12_027337 [Muraenolepis orangiensis]
MNLTSGLDPQSLTSDPTNMSVWDDLDLLLDSPPGTLVVASSARGTVKASANFKIDEDVKALRKAIEGAGTTEETLVEVLTNRSNAQRLLISAAYQKAAGRSLIDDLEGDTRGDFEDVLVAMVTPPDLYDCREVIGAMKSDHVGVVLDPFWAWSWTRSGPGPVLGLVLDPFWAWSWTRSGLWSRPVEGAGTSECVLTEIFASRSNKQMATIREAYLAETGKKLTVDLLTEVSGEYGQALVLLAEGKRSDSAPADAAKAKADAKALYEAGEKKWGTDEMKFVEILCNSSVPQLRLTMVEYKTLSNKSLQDSIEGEMSGSLEDLLVAIVKCAKSTSTYLAERLYKAMKGPGTTESTLTRILVSRSELDLLDIRAEYKKLFGTSIYSDLLSEVSGEYGECLKRLCGGED